MVIPLDQKRKVELPNFGINEGQCKCGCGLVLADKLVLKVQAFIFFLERKYGSKFRILTTSGARCQKHNKDEGGAVDSRHLHCDAIDGIFQVRTKEGTWVQIPNATIASEAQSIGLFGGIGMKRYEIQGKNLVHLDDRPGTTPVIW